MGKIAESSDLRCRNRAVLHEVIPLQAPFLLGIEPTNICNLKCKFCPTGDPQLVARMGRKNGIMSFDLFRKIVDEARKFPVKIKEVCLFKDGEPLLHKDIVRMIRYIKQADICERIKLFTNGLLLNPDLNAGLAEAGLDFLRVSVEGVSPQRYMELCNVDIKYDEFLNNIADYYRIKKRGRLVAKIIDVNLTDVEKKKFFDDFSQITDLCAVEDIHGWTYSSMKDFSLGIRKKTFDGVPVKEKMVCPYPFYSMTVNCLGITTIGCCDWALKTEIGNAARESVVDIWNGKQMFNFRMMHLQHRREENPACACCSHMQINPDSLDGYESKIINVLSIAAAGGWK